MVNPESDSQERAQPRYFYGYVVVVASFFIIMVAFGLYGTYGIFFNPLLEEFGWNRATTSAAYSLSMTVHGVLAILMGSLNDRFGPRIVLTSCGLILGLGYLLMSQVNSLWNLYLFYGIIIGVGMSGIWIPLLSTVARWFNRRRSLMSGIVVSGGGIGSLIVSPSIGWLVSVYGWRTSYMIVGGIVLVVALIAAQFLKRDPQKVGQLPFGESRNPHLDQKPLPVVPSYSLREAVRTRRFWLAFLMFMCFGFCMVAIVVHIVPHAIDLGVPAVMAANILAIRGGMGILGSYLLGGLGDRIGNRKLFMLGFIMFIAALFWLMPASEMWMLYLFIVVYGLALGGMNASESPFVASLFGLRSHGMIYGIVGLGFTVGASIGPIVTGYIYDLTSSYQTAFILCVGFAVVGLALGCLLRPSKR